MLKNIKGDPDIRDTNEWHEWISLIELCVKQARLDLNMVSKSRNNGERAL